MKVCPNCGLTNDERAPLCGLCHTSLVYVPAILAVDPNHPEHARRALIEERHKIARKQTWMTGFFYACAITLTAACPGFILTPHLLGFYFISGVVVPIVVARDWAGQFAASFFQGLLSFLLMIIFGSMHPFIFFMLLGHIVLPMLLWFCIDMIDSANR